MGKSTLVQIGTNSSQTILGVNLIDRIDGRGGADKLSGLAGNDDIRGGLGNDQLFGGIGNDKLTGDSGNDRMLGGPGTDILTPGTGVDRMNGGNDNNKDIFVFNTRQTFANRDFIVSFDASRDKIHLDNADFIGIGPTGMLRANVFKLASQVKDADDRIIFDDFTGRTYYDADGSGPKAPVLFLTLDYWGTINRADFVVI